MSARPTRNRCAQLAGIVNGTPALVGGACVIQSLRADLNPTILGARTNSPLVIPVFFSIEMAGQVNRSLCLGEAALTEQEVSIVSRALEQQGIMTTAKHNHWLFESPRIIYLHWEARMDPEQFLRASRRALQAARVQTRPLQMNVGGGFGFGPGDGGRYGYDRGFRRRDEFGIRYGDGYGDGYDGDGRLDEGDWRVGCGGDGGFAGDWRVGGGDRGRDHRGDRNDCDNGRGRNHHRDDDDSSGDGRGRDHHRGDDDSSGDGRGRDHHRGDDDSSGDGRGRNHHRHENDCDNGRGRNHRGDQNEVPGGDDGDNNGRGRRRRRCCCTTCRGRRR